MNNEYVVYFEKINKSINIYISLDYAPELLETSEIFPYKDIRAEIFKETLLSKPTPKDIKYAVRINLFKYTSGFTLVREAATNDIDEIALVKKFNKIKALII